MKKKLSLIVLAVAFVMILSACSSSNKAPSNSDNSISNDTEVINTNIDKPEEKEVGTSNSTEDFLKTITAETAEAKGVCGPDLTWYYKDNVLVIKGTGKMADYTGLSPNTAWGQDSGTELYKKINWVVIQEGVTSIGDRAFEGCELLSKIELPSTLERIGEFAIDDNCQLEKITIPASVTYIGSFGNRNLKEVTFLGDAPEGADMLIYPTTEKVYYSGTGFDEIIEEKSTKQVKRPGSDEITIEPSGIEWIKQ